jgi:hypothetical protein
MLREKKIRHGRESGSLLTAEWLVIQRPCSGAEQAKSASHWIPAFAGMTS